MFHSIYEEANYDPAFTKLLKNDKHKQLCYSEGAVAPENKVPKLKEYWNMFWLSETEGLCPLWWDPPQ